MEPAALLEPLDDADRNYTEEIGQMMKEMDGLKEKEKNLKTERESLESQVKEETDLHEKLETQWKTEQKRTQDVLAPLLSSLSILQDKKQSTQRILDETRNQSKVQAGLVTDLDFLDDTYNRMMKEKTALLKQMGDPTSFGGHLYLTESGQPLPRPGIGSSPSGSAANSAKKDLEAEASNAGKTTPTSTGSESNSSKPSQESLETLRSQLTAVSKEKASLEANNTALRGQIEGFLRREQERASALTLSGPQIEERTKRERLAKETAARLRQVQERVTSHREQLATEEEREHYFRLELEELSLRQGELQQELSLESRRVDKELQRLRKEAASQEAASRQAEEQHVQLTALWDKRSEEASFLRQKLANVSRHNSGDASRGWGELGMVNSLEFEKKELRGDIESALRFKSKLEASVRELGEQLERQQAYVLHVVGRISDLSEVSTDVTVPSRSRNEWTRDEVSRLNNASENKGVEDMKELVERVGADNVKLERRIRVLRAKMMTNRQTPGSTGVTRNSDD